MASYLSHLWSFLTSFTNSFSSSKIESAQTEWYYQTHFMNERTEIRSVRYLCGRFRSEVWAEP